jgi:hypothetical protein
VLRRILYLVLALTAPPLAAAEQPGCAETMRQVREALAVDQDLAEDGRATVEQLLRDAAQALKAGEGEICREMMEDAKELLGLDSED